MEDTKNQEETEQKVRMFTPREEEVIGEVIRRVIPNINIYIDEKLQEVIEILKDTEDIKVNITTLSTLLAAKGFFKQEEFTECFRDMMKSFGVVRKDGTMEGMVEITDYNFLKS